MDRKIQLDILRGVCGYLVAISHFYYFYNNNIIFEQISIVCVEVFFILSGYVLANQLIKVHEDKKKFITFILRRLYRTLPLYFCALILASLIYGKLFSKEFFYYLTFTQNIILNEDFNDYYTIAWSLSVEEFFYFFFPIFLILFYNFSFLKIILSFVLLITISRFFFIFLTSYDIYEIRTFTLLRLDAIGIGVLIYYFQNKIVYYKNLLQYFSIILLLLITLNYQILLNDKLLFIFIIQFFSILIFLLFLFIRISKINRLFNSFFLLISNQTYSIYLLHILLLAVGSNLTFLKNIYFYLITLFIASYLIYNFFEKPILLKRPKY